MRPRTRVLLGLVIVVALIGAFVAVRARHEVRRASTRPDQSQWITAEVTERSLKSLVTTRGSFAVADERTLMAPSKPDGAAILAVTATPVRAGADLRGGSAAMEFNGRPLLVLAALIPIYQAIHPGDRGPEVSALQDGLAAAGRLAVGDERGTFGTRTQQAVDRLYRGAGYEPPYGAGSQAAYERGIQDRQRAVDAARDVANEARAQGTIDAGADAAYERALADRRTFADSQGVMVSPDELVTVPKLPLTVLRLDAQRGDAIEAGAPALTLGSRAAALDVGLSAAQISQVRGQVTVDVTSEAGTYRGTCAYVKPAAATTSPPPSVADPAASTGPSGDEASPATGAEPAADAADYSFRTICDPAPPAALDGSGATVSLRATVARKGLVVPSTAVSVDPSGASWVTVVDGSRGRRVDVTVLADAGGFSSIGVPSDRVRAGDEVRVRDR